MSRRAKRAAIPVLCYILLPSLLAAWHGAWWWAERNNTLYGTGKWISGKDTGKFVFYSYAFLFRPLRHSCVNLSADMGYQEILYHQPEDAERRLQILQAEFLLDPGAYLWTELHKNGLSFLGVRVSRNSDYPSGFYLFDTKGRIVSHLPFTTADLTIAEGWYKLTLIKRARVWHLYIDQRPIAASPEIPDTPGFVGFRGSGNPRAAAKVKNIRLTFTDPHHPGNTVTIVEKFSTRRLVRSIFAYVLATAAAIMSLRFLRSVCLSLLLVRARRNIFLRSEAAGIVVVSLLLALIPPVPSGRWLVLYLLCAEIITGAALIIAARHSSVAVTSRTRGLLFVSGMLPVLLVTATFWMLEGTPLRFHPVAPEKMAGVHPCAFLRFPDPDLPSRPYHLTRPLQVIPGRPFFIPDAAFREQKIVTEFVLGSNTTLDVVFQQQSYRTRGDPDGELLPLQRHLVRVSTHPDVPMGLGIHTGNRPAPFLAIGPQPLPGVTNHLEILSRSAGLQITFNGKRTFTPRFKPLGRGETGVMTFDGPATILKLNVEPLPMARLRSIGLRFAGLPLPLLLAALFFSSIKVPRCQAFTLASAATNAVLFPFMAYLVAALAIGRESLEFLGRARLQWFDLSIASCLVAAMMLCVALRNYLRRPALLFNLLFAVLLAAVATTIWDSLPEDHPLRLRFTEQAQAPGEIVRRPRGRQVPWYSNNRYIGASTYVWRQEFGGERILIPKPAGTVRIFVVGGSQAWGSGAANSQSTFAELLEKKLAARGLPVEIYNAGVNGAGLSKILVYYQQLLRQFQPDIILADVGLNDSAVLAQKKNPASRRKHVKLLLSLFSELLDACSRDKADFVLCLEPMSMELGLRPDPDLYRGMENAVRQRGWITVNPLPITAKKEKRQILWWDTAHFAPAGHYLMAELLVEPTAEAVRRRLAARHLSP